MSGTASGTPAGTVADSPARNQGVIGAPSSAEEPGIALVPLGESYVAYRGPWLDFHPDSRIWGG